MKQLCKIGHYFLLSLIALTFMGCGYRFGTEERSFRQSTLSIPYVEGDQEGFFTQALIKAVASRGRFSFRSYGADLVLKVCLNGPEEMTVGFAYAPKKETDGTRFVVSNEARLCLRAEVTLIDQAARTALLGPFEIRESLDFDYEPDLGRFDANAFSLGQLEMHPLAQETAFSALSTLLAAKIADYISNCKLY